MRKYRKAYGLIYWRRRDGICREMNRVNNSIRRGYERLRNRWRSPKTRHMMSCMRGWTLKEGEHTLYRLARQRHQAGKDAPQVRLMKDTYGNIMTDEESVLRIWKEYYKGLMNDENEREKGE